MPLAEGAGVTTEEGDPAELGRVPAGDTELRGVAPAVGAGVIVALARVVGFGVAGGDVMGAGEAEDGVAAGVAAAIGGGLTCR